MVKGQVNEKSFRKLVFLENKRAWTKMIEVFVAILLLASVLTIILQNDESPNHERFEEVYEKQHSDFKEIQMNDSLRSDVLSGKVSKKINNTFNESFSDLDCKAKTCSLRSSCGLKEEVSEDVYAQSANFFANETDYKPKKLKVFCW